MPPGASSEVSEVRSIREDSADEADSVARIVRWRAVRLRAARQAQQVREARVRVLTLARAAHQAREAQLRADRAGGPAHQDRETRLRFARAAQDAEQTRETPRREATAAGAAEQFRETRLREARAAREAQQVRETLLRVVNASREERERAREVRERTRGATRDESEIFITRVTTLLACICLLRFQQPLFSNHIIVFFLRYAFFEIFITARDVEVIFRATCRNHARWLLQICHTDDFEQREMAWELLERMRADSLVHYLPQLIRGLPHDRRYAIRYLHCMVGGADPVPITRGRTMMSLLERV